MLVTTAALASSCRDIKLTSPRLEIEANIFTRLSVITADRIK